MLRRLCRAIHSNRCMQSAASELVENTEHSTANQVKENEFNVLTDLQDYKADEVSHTQWIREQKEKLKNIDGPAWLGKNHV